MIREDDLINIVGSRNVSFLEPVLQSYSMNIKPLPHQYGAEQGDRDNDHQRDQQDRQESRHVLAPPACSP